MSNSIKRFLGGLLWTGVIISCGDDGGAASQTDACETMCAKLELCDSNTDESDCVEECVSNRSLSVGAIAGYSECVDDASCDELGVADSFDDCFERVLSGLKLSVTATNFCEYYAALLEECNSDYDENEIKQQCSDDVRGYSEQYVNALIECFDEPCDNMGECFSDVNDEYNAETIEEEYYY